MQAIGWLELNGERVMVLVRQSKHWRNIKLAKGVQSKTTKTISLDDEQIFLSEHPELVEKLKAGEVISL